MTPDPARDQVKQPAAANPVGRRGLLLAACWLLLGVLGWLDDVTGYEMSFFVFYSVPVGVAAWYVGRWPAIGVALGATVTWLLADYSSGERYSSWPAFFAPTAAPTGRRRVETRSTPFLRPRCRHRNRPFGPPVG